MGGRLGTGVGGVVSPFVVPPPPPRGGGVGPGEMREVGYPGAGAGAAAAGAGAGVAAFGAGAAAYANNKKGQGQGQGQGQGRGYGYNPSSEYLGPQQPNYAYSSLSPNPSPAATPNPNQYLSVSGVSPPHSPPPTVSDAGSSSGSAYHHGGVQARDPQYTAQGYPVPGALSIGGGGPGRALTQRTEHTTSSGSVYSSGSASAGVPVGGEGPSAKQREALGVVNPTVQDWDEGGEGSGGGGGKEVTVAVDAGRVTGRDEIPPTYESLLAGAGAGERRD